MKFSDEKLLELYRQGLTDKEIADELGVKPPSVRYAAESANKAADSIKEVTESLKECLHIFREGIEFLANRKDYDNIT
jgi:predicted transcriptional regulator